MSKKQKKELIKLFISIFLFLFLIVLKQVTPLLNNNYIEFSIYIIVYIFIAYKVIIKAFKRIINIQFFDENFLMVIATIGAFILGEYSEALAVILFYQMGEFFQEYAVSQSRNSISDLINIMPDYANLINDSELIKIDPEEVKIGDIILVKPGEKIPIDGVIIEGSSSIDVKALTGEAEYKDVIINDYVLSGSVNINGTLKIKTEKEYRDSTFSKILELVENASSIKSNPEKFITKFAKIYTPIVVILAVLVAIIPGLITGDYDVWTYRALNFLVVSCPCALVISIPLSFFTGIGKASKLGILIKGSVYIENFNKVKTFIFDKTGTITKGNFVVSNVISDDEEMTMKYAYIAEYNSNHPIASSICKYYLEKFDNIKLTNSQIKEVPGKGIIAKYDNKEILCGNRQLLEDKEVVLPSINELGTKVYVAYDNVYVGAIIINDEIKEKSYEVIEYLNKKKYKAIILSGDNEEIVRNVSGELGVSESYSSLLPLEKQLLISEIKKQKELVCFIGDGINDSPSLITADIGISMGLNGSDAAIEASDIVLMDDDIYSVVRLKKLSERIMRIVYQNIALALGIKTLVLILSFLGLTSMWLAIFADVGVAILAILNSFRIGLFKK